MSNLDNVAVTKFNKKKMSITIDVDLLDEFNRIAKINKYNKSQTISNLIRVFVTNEKNIIK